MGKIFRCEIPKGESLLRFKDIEDKLDLKGFFVEKSQSLCNTRNPGKIEAI